ncbi:MAG: 30S ribosomal protein S12 methylthiotransferase RimO [Anaerolineales bacterium]|nr:30S ribosomal protein S12 methylthiotransferase RimO [Anaerolineales bacterium]
MKRSTFYFETLGCPKNLVDTDSISVLLHEAGRDQVGTPEAADVLIVNTCGFIEPAREESIEILQQLAGQKNPQQLLIAAGCMAERTPQRILAEVPEVDGVISTRRWREIGKLLEQLESETDKQKPVLIGSPAGSPGVSVVPRTAEQGASAYLKIADGCRRSCAYCSIPLIKGTASSRSVEDITADAVRLQQRGVREIVLIAQDVTDYGIDLGLKDGLPGLLEALLPNIPDVDWVRLMYAYPDRVSERLVDLMAFNPQLIPYLDIPLQHADSEVLRRMRRPRDIESTIQFLYSMREKMPDLVLRTTFIVGFPGETDPAFSRLVDLVEEELFDHVGVFPYFFEPGTPAEKDGDPIPDEVKQERLEHLMLLQQEISLHKHQALVGTNLDVLIEGVGDGISVGRSYRDAPEVDGVVILTEEVDPGEIKPVLITGARPYDLVGQLAN